MAGYYFGEGGDRAAPGVPESSGPRRTGQILRDLRLPHDPLPRSRAPA